MLIKPYWVTNTLIIQTTDGGLAYVADDWPETFIPITTLLHCLFGAPCDGWFVYHERDHRWLFTLLDRVREGFKPGLMLALAIEDRAAVGKNSNDPEWIMQDPRGYPEMEKGGHSNPHLGRNVRVRQAAFYQRWQAEGPGTGWVILVNE